MKKQTKWRRSRRSEGEANVELTDNTNCDFLFQKHSPFVSLVHVTSFVPLVLSVSIKLKWSDPTTLFSSCWYIHIVSVVTTLDSRSATVRSSSGRMNPAPATSTVAPPPTQGGGYQGSRNNNSVLWLGDVSSKHFSHRWLLLILLLVINFVISYWLVIDFY